MGCRLKVYIDCSVCIDCSHSYEHVYSGSATSDKIEF